MRMIDRYEILGRLGRGGMGAVYKARLPELGRIVAVKLLDPVEHMVDLLGLDKLSAQFLREARIMAGLSHPHIAGVLDLGSHQGKPYFVMEYVCDNLGALIGEDYIVEDPTRRLGPERAVSYALQALDGLSVLHHHGIVHRDVKPYNMLVTLDDQVKLIDFGLSKLRGETRDKGPDNMMVGSPYYTAPEQERDPESATVRSDLFSAGVMLYRFLTGELPPHVGGGAGENALEELFPGIMDDRWTAFFDRVLEHKSDRRFESAQEMAESLSDLYDDFREKLEAACTLAEPEPQPPCAAPHGGYRQEPLKTGPRDGLRALGLNRLGKPETCVANAFHATEATVLDRATGLMWERGGSAFPMVRDLAADRIQGLNSDAHLGYTDWRLPTAEELSTLIDPGESLAEFCMDALFDARQRRLWSSDRRTYLSSWSLNAAMGFIGWHDHTCRLFVRAVRTAGQA